MEANVSAIEQLARLLGEDVFFVPCEWGTKKPVVTCVERPFEGAKSPAYRALFESQPVNINRYEFAFLAHACTERCAGEYNGGPSEGDGYGCFTAIGACGAMGKAEVQEQLKKSGK